VLNRQVKKAQELMPNRTIFCIHGTVLVLYLVCSSLGLYFYELRRHLITRDAKLKALIASNIFYILSFMFECAGFLLVLYILLPTTNGQAKRRKDLQKVFLLGFVDINQLKDAVLAQNEDLDEEER
jgi:hypothetical protein